MGKSKGGSMKTERKTKMKANNNKKQKTSIQFGNKKVFWGLVAFAVVVLGVVGWNVYWDWADESNMKQIETAAQTLQAREKIALKNGTFTEKRECTEPTEGWLGTGQLFCEVIETTFLPVHSSDEVKGAINSHYQVILSSADIVKTEELPKTDNLYPDLSNGLEVANSSTYSGRSTSQGIRLKSKVTGGCMVAYSLLSSKSAAEYLVQFKNTETYYLKATLRCSADTKKRYY